MSDKSERRKRIRREKRRQRRKDRSLKRTVRVVFGWLLSILIAVVLGYGLVSYCFQTVYVVGDSMSPSYTNEEKVVVNKISYLFGKPDRYDVVAYRSVDTPDEYYDIKRVIGLPGETVRIQDGKVFINDKELKDTPFDDYIFTAGLAENEITLSDDEYFLLGDNVNNSEDSRFLKVGNVKKAEMLGRIKQK
jgi:signal peptidase I